MQFICFAKALKRNSHSNGNTVKTGGLGAKERSQKTFRKIQVFIGYASWEGFLIEWCLESSRNVLSNV